MEVTSMPTLSAVVFSNHGSKATKRCIDSVRFADEVILIATGKEGLADPTLISSLDGYYEMPAQYVEVVRNKGIDKAHGDYVLILDADEEIPPTLAQAIKTHLQSGEAQPVIALPRKNLMFDRFIKHSGWWPDYQIRLFQRGRVGWGKQIHAPPEFTGEPYSFEAIEELAFIHHHIHSVDDYLGRISQFTKVTATERSTPTSPKKMVAAFRDELVKRLYALEGYKDGDVGVYLSFLQAYYQFLVELRVWEKEGFPKQAVNIDREISSLIRDLRYWQATKQMNHTTSALWRFWYQIRRKFRL
jgi:(heptosyl)LPS beta-1,4-glucosyltransferase